MQDLKFAKFDKSAQIHLLSSDTQTKSKWLQPYLHFPESGKMVDLNCPACLNGVPITVKRMIPVKTRDGHIAVVWWTPRPWYVRWLKRITKTFHDLLTSLKRVLDSRTEAGVHASFVV